MLRPFAGRFVWIALFVVGGWLGLGPRDALAQVPPAAKPKPPQLRESPMSIPVPSPIGDFAVGGQGRYVVLQLPALKQLAVFDVEQLRIIKRLTFTSESFLFAAGSTRFVTYDPTTKRFTRYRFDTFAVEAESEPIEDDISNIAMGASSEGPIGAVAPRRDRVVFFDLKTFKPIPSLDKDDPGIGFGDPQFLRASPDGKLFAGWDTGSPTGLNIYQVNANGSRRTYEHEDVGQTVPGGDGKIYAAGGVFHPNGKPVIKTERYAFQPRVPAVDGPYSLKIPFTNHGRIEKAAESPTICRNFGLETVATIEHRFNIEWETFVGNGREKYPIDRRIILIPSAELLITIPKDRDFVELNRLKLPAP